MAGSGRASRGNLRRGAGATGSRGGTTGSNAETRTRSDSERDPAGAAEAVVAVEAVAEALVEVVVEAVEEAVEEALAEAVVEAVVVVSEAEIRDADNQTN